MHCRFAGLGVAVVETAWIAYGLTDLCCASWLDVTDKGVLKHAMVNGFSSVALADGWLKALAYACIAPLTVIFYFVVRRWIVLVASGCTLLASIVYLIKSLLRHVTADVPFAETSKRQQQQQQQKNAPNSRSDRRLADASGHSVFNRASAADDLNGMLNEAFDIEWEDDDLAAIVSVKLKKDARQDNATRLTLLNPQTDENANEC